MTKSSFYMMSAYEQSSYIRTDSKYLIKVPFLYHLYSNGLYTSGKLQ